MFSSFRLALICSFKPVNNLVLFFKNFQGCLFTDRLSQEMHFILNLATNLIIHRFFVWICNKNKILSVLKIRSSVSDRLTRKTTFYTQYLLRCFSLEGSVCLSKPILSEACILIRGDHPYKIAQQNRCLVLYSDVFPLDGCLFKYVQCSVTQLCRSMFSIYFNNTDHW